LSNNLIKGLQLLYIKDKHTISEQAFNEILEIFEISNISLYRLRTILGKIVPLKPKLIDICWNSCCAFTGKNIICNTCPICKEPRYITKKKTKKSRKQLAYFSIIDSLKLQYNNPARAKDLRYRYEYTSKENFTSDDSKIGDVFDGNRYKTLVASGFFLDYRDIALIASMDGYQVFKQNRNDCWIILLLNANLSPSQRVKKENLMINMVIPGPKSPKDFNSFLQPLVDELKQLESNY
jgi:hypothetical protein